MRTMYCGEVTEAVIGQEIELVGWINKQRDLGGVTFLDMRDRAGIVQVFFDGDTPEATAVAASVRNEFCVKIKGQVRARPEGQVNKEMVTGNIEICGLEMEVLNRSEPLPLDSNQTNSEEQRLRYRYLDLRRPVMAERMVFRSKVSSFVRRFLDDNGFLDVETPILTKATPEGARDYLVPSRTHKGQFFALPQSPQLFKQLLMMSGMDKYYQIVKCFRDEDLRADRQPEFTQIDIETSFMSGEQVMDITEEMIVKLFKEMLDVDLGKLPLNEEIVTELLKRTNAQDGDILMFGADKANIVSEAIGALRLKVAEDLGLIKDQWKPLWVIDFPMFEPLEDGALTPLHHPFTAPIDMTAEELEANPVGAISNAYDMVLNGCDVNDRHKLNS